MYYYGLLTLLLDSDNLECVLGFSPLDFNLFILKLPVLGRRRRMLPHQGKGGGEEHDRKVLFPGPVGPRKW